MEQKSTPKFVRASYAELQFEGVPYLKAAIERDWGLFYKRRNLVATAKRHCDESILLRPEGFQPRIIKTQCQLNYGDVSEALESARECVETFPCNVQAQHIRNECIYETNCFENSLLECSKTDRVFEPKIKKTLFETDLVRATINHTIGPEAGPCLHKMRKDIQLYHEHALATVQTKDRPLWQQRKDAGECDACSVVSERKHIENPLRLKRAQRKASNNLRMYFGADMARDIEFLQKLRTDKRIGLSQTPVSASLIFDTIDTELARINLWKNQLWKRNPVYAKRRSSSVACDSTKAKETEASLNRIQYQTRREAFAHLCRVRQLLMSNFDGALEYVEQISRDFFAVKTRRVLPRRAEFIVEVYNLVGLTCMRRYCIVPHDLMTMPTNERLSALLQVPAERNPYEDPKPSDGFGARAEFMDPDAPDVSYFSYKQRVNGLELRIQQCEHAEERCYLWQQLSNVHVAQRKLDDVKPLAANIIAAANQCGNKVWLLLGHLADLRADCVQQQIIRLGEKLERLAAIAAPYGSMVKHYVAVAIIAQKDHMRDVEQHLVDDA